MGLRIAVIGAGIGGLTLASALRRAGMACEVFEQSAQLGEVGAGVQLAPNAVRLLHRLGLREKLAARCVRPASIDIRRWDDGALLSRTPLGRPCENMYGAPYLTAHRADLHAALRTVMVEPLRLGRCAVRVERHANRVVVRFTDGGAHEADVVVGADGIHSVVRDGLIPDAPVYSGHTIFRGLVPADRLPAPVGDATVTVWAGPGRHFVAYPVRASELISFAATVASPSWRAESWSAEGNPAELAGAYQGWHHAVTDLIKAAGTLRRWALHDRPPVERWSEGRLTLLGDAAHPMLPFLAQGANQAIEDAFALAACLAGRSPAETPSALLRYQQVRVHRTALIQTGSRQGGAALHMTDGPGQRERDTLMRDTATLRAMEWLYGHDAETITA